MGMPFLLLLVEILKRGGRLLNTSSFLTNLDQILVLFLLTIRKNILCGMVIINFLIKIL